MRLASTTNFFVVATLVLTAHAATYCAANNTCSVNADCNDNYRLCCGGFCSMPAALNASIGRLNEGQACNASDFCGQPCADGLVCSGGVCTALKTPGCACNVSTECIGLCLNGACVAAELRIGFACQNDSQCLSGSCNATSLVCATNPSPAPAGSPCGRDRGCDVGLYCNVDYDAAWRASSGGVDVETFGLSVDLVYARAIFPPPQGTCAAKAAVNASCVPMPGIHLPCGSAVVVDYQQCEGNGTCSSAGVCVGGGGLGHDCSEMKPCGDSTVCFEGACVARCSAADGTRCFFHDQCRSGCYGGFCGAPVLGELEAGANCTNSYQCKGHASDCLGGVCVDRMGAPVNFTDGAVCGTGRPTCAPISNDTAAGNASQADAMCGSDPYFCWVELSAALDAGITDMNVLRRLQGKLACCLGCASQTVPLLGDNAASCGNFSLAHDEQCASTSSSSVALVKCPTPPPVNCTPCPADQYAAVPCTLFAEATCKACTVCAEGQYAVLPCSDVADTVCAPCTACAPGTVEQAPCTANANAVCGACTPCDLGSWKANMCDACQPCSDCGTGTYRQIPCVPNADTVCKPCTVCGPNSHEIIACGPTGDTVCAPCPGGGACGSAPQTAKARAGSGAPYINRPALSAAPNRTAVDKGAVLCLALAAVFVVMVTPF